VAGDLNEKWEKLVAIAERLASQPVVVNVNFGDGTTTTKRKRGALRPITSPETEPEVPEPTGYPRPFVS
jgi:hypothetical protein